MVTDLEEGELLRIRRCYLVQGREELHDHMGVAENLASAVQRLGGGEVVGLGIDELTSCEIPNGHLDVEERVGGDGGTVLGVRDLARGHVVDVRNHTDGGRVAGAGLNLFAVGDRKVGYRQTEVDEIISRCQGSDLAFEYILFHVFLCRCQITYRLLGHPVRYLQIQSR